MPPLVPRNAVVDIYRGFNIERPYPGHGSQRVRQGVHGHLRPAASQGRLGHGLGLPWTHVLYLPLGIDLRSAYNSQLQSWQPTEADTIVLADYPLVGWCTAFLVVLLQHLYRRQTGACLAAYLDRLRPRPGPCFQGPCPDPLPATLYATVPPDSGCPCLDGLVIPLAYAAVIDAWSGSATVCANEHFHLVFHAGNHSCHEANLTVSFENHGTVGPIAVDPDCRCSPAYYAFSNILFPELGVTCHGPISVVITASP